MHVEPVATQKMRVIVAYGPYRVGDIIQPFASARSGLLWRRWAEDYGFAKPGDRDIEEEYRKLYASLPQAKEPPKTEQTSGDIVGFQTEPVAVETAVVAVQERHKKHRKERSES